MVKNKNKLMWIVLSVLIFFTVKPGLCTNVIDMSELITKIQSPAIFYDLGEKGVAVYDVGDRMMKFFDWNFKFLSQFPIVKGEGPGEVKNFITSACIVEGKTYVLVFYDKNIKVFDSMGKFEKVIPLDSKPRDMLFKNGSLYLPNMRINATENSFSLGIIADPFTGKKTKEIYLKERLIAPDNINGEPGMIGMSSTIDVGNDSSIYFLNSLANLLVVIDGKDQVKYKIDLPYKHRELRRTYKENGEDVLELNTLDWYPDMRAFDDGVYVCFQRTLNSNSKDDEKKYQTVIIKVSAKDKISEKVFEGQCIIIGQHKGNLYLFNSVDYTVIPVKLSDW